MSELNAELRLKADMTTGDGVIKCENVHIHLPAPIDGAAYEILNADGVVRIHVVEFKEAE